MSRLGAIAIGIDVGGTKTSLGQISIDDGQILERRQLPTPSGQASGAAFLEKVACEAEGLAASGQEIVSVGIGICELVDLEGNIKSAYRVQWEGLPVRDRLSAIAPVTIESDVRAAAMAEALFGAGAPYRQFLYLNIGTGVSASWVSDGRPHRGTHGDALVLASGPWRQTSRGTEETLEDIAGGAGLVARYNSRAKTSIPGASELLALATQGDDLACALIEDAAQSLGVALGSILGLLDPDALIIGGGLGSSPGRYQERLEKEVRRHIWSPATRNLEIRQTRLGTDGGLIGAALAGAHGISSPKLR